MDGFAFASVICTETIMLGTVAERQFILYPNLVNSRNVNQNVGFITDET